MTRFPPRRILVPVDLSKASKSARAWAHELGGDAAVTILYVVGMTPMAATELPQPLLTAHLKRRLLSRLRKDYPKAARHVVAEGDAASVIVAHGRNADLIVMATHGRKGLDRALLGSVSEAVVRRSGTPVLVARKPPRKVRSVLAPVTLAPYARRGLELAASAALALGAELVALHVEPARPSRGPRAGFFLHGMLEGLEIRHGHKLRTRLVEAAGEVIPTILSESKKHDLVVLTAHRKSLLHDLVLGTTAERVLRHAPVPVLTVPSKESRS
jgi:nucleotide-binding universal stress UspA family protein